MRSSKLPAPSPRRRGPPPRSTTAGLVGALLGLGAFGCESGDGAATVPADTLILSDTGGLDAQTGDTDGDTGGDTGGDAQGADTQAPAAPDFSKDAILPAAGHRKDILGLGPALPAVATQGLAYALSWPVDVSGVLLPARWMQTLFDAEATDEVTIGLQDVARTLLGFGDLVEMVAWLGLPNHDGSAEAFPGVAWPDNLGEMTGFGDVKPLGVGIVETDLAPAMSFSCATCHVGDLFGHTIVGMTNRRTRANEFFHLAKGFFPSLSADLLQPMTNATEAEMTQFLATQKNLAAIENIVPAAQGLDTSLAQVALSLSRRRDDEWATKDPALEESPRENALRTEVADSKPAVWWTLKYKTRWLLDGSIVSGNPVFTNFLWNELGRGTDLHELDAWLSKNEEVVNALTALVFANEPPRFSDIFGEERLDLEAAKRGQPLFEAHCSGCHGSYAKAWDVPGVDGTVAELTRTTRVDYPSPTPVLDVGTDLKRAQGMQHFAAALNKLAISKAMGTVVEPQAGYVPPPLDGIFARYPYLHNQSVPNLCALLTPASERPQTFWMGPDVDPETDYDFDCVGLPAGPVGGVGKDVPASWKEDPRREMDTTRPGLSNQGHDAFLINDDGEPVLDAAQRRDLIEFLKTL
jgi:hypothetical protein